MPSINDQLQKAWQQLQGGNTQGALGLIDAALKRAPHNPQALCLLGMARVAMDDAATAVAPLERALKTDPRNGMALDTLGLALSDYALKPFVAYFFHANPRHHSIALIESDRDAIHHLMVEVCSLDDVGQTYDMALAEPGRIGTTLGRHTNDHVTSFYATTPSDFLMEYGWGGRTLDTGNWQPYEMHYGTSLWGHERNWLPPDKMEEARSLRAKAAADAQREPVQVMPGNHVMSHGSCPWWDNIKARGGPA